MFLPTVNSWLAVIHFTVFNLGLLLCYISHPPAVEKLVSLYDLEL